VLLDAGTVRVFRRVLDRNVHSMTPLDPTPARLKLVHARDQWQSSRVFIPLAGWHCKLGPNTEGVPPVLGALVSGWVPTINWTLQFKHRPQQHAAQPQPQHPPAIAGVQSVAKGALPSASLRFKFTTTTVIGGFLEEDGELWDGEGRLVALHGARSLHDGFCLRP
jgi:hypothetical protein